MTEFRVKLIFEKLTFLNFVALFRIAFNQTTIWPDNDYMQMISFYSRQKAKVCK